MPYICATLLLMAEGDLLSWEGNIISTYSNPTIEVPVMLGNNQAETPDNGLSYAPPQRVSI